MLDISLIMILAALWGAPAGASQADFSVDYSGENHRAYSCQGTLRFDKRAGAETLRFQQTCKGAGAQDENREMILRFDRHKAYQINHALKRYDAYDIGPLEASMQELIGKAGALQTQDFLEGTRLWLQPTNQDFWLMGVQEPSRQGRLSELHLIAPGYGSHMYLSYASEPASDSYEPPKDYKQEE